MFLTSLVTVSSAGFALVGCARATASPGTGPTGKSVSGHDDKDRDDRPDDKDRQGDKQGDRQGDKDEADEVTPAEDLMREHGVLRRVMYLYDDAADRLTGRRDLPLDALGACAGIVRRVIEDYHEKLEEDFLFPRFEKAGKLADLTAVLRRQHVAGRTLTAQITQLTRAPLADADRARLAAALRSFNHMYRPHAAREDTVLFPELRGLVGKRAYEELGDQFEDKEKQMLGDHGFEHAVEEVAKLEQAFGLDDLAKLTPAP
ncbi:MAG TPA: hemerythrin domain-containing protein [Kofleriaceae bacterium]|nr:hemerythrin domain-containing protein [Kofleriaceae bacterium]